MKTSYTHAGGEVYPATLFQNAIRMYLGRVRALSECTSLALDATFLSVEATARVLQHTHINEANCETSSNNCHALLWPLIEWDANGIEQYEGSCTYRIPFTNQHFTMTPLFQTLRRVWGSECPVQMLLPGG